MVGKQEQGVVFPRGLFRKDRREQLLSDTREFLNG